MHGNSLGLQSGEAGSFTEGEEDSVWDTINQQPKPAHCNDNSLKIDSGPILEPGDAWGVFQVVVAVGTTV